MAIKGLIFDLDGVLVDTVPTHFKAWERMFHEHGYAFDEKIYREKVDGRLRYDGAQEVMHDKPREEVIVAANRKNKYYLEMIDDGDFKVFEDTEPFLKQVRAHGLKIAAASSSANVHTILEKAGLTYLFDYVVGGHQVARGKPNPDIFVSAANGLGLKPEEAIVFEDAEAGVLAAKRGGFFCVGIEGHDTEADLSLADMHAKSIGKLGSLLPIL